MLPKSALVPALAGVLLAAPCKAQSEDQSPAGFRLHTGAQAAFVVGGPRVDELRMGFARFDAVEWAPLPELGLMLLVGGLWRHDDDALARAAGGLDWRPFARSFEGSPSSTELISPAGGWMALAGGAALVSHAARPTLEVALGFDFLLERGRFALGPMVGYLHVFSPDTDPKMYLVGIHAMFDGVRSAAAPHDRAPPPDCPEQHCPDPDQDDDGLVDGADSCPSQPEDRDHYEDADGCPDPDDDQRDPYLPR